MSAITPIIRLLGPNDASVLERVAPDVFDDPISPQQTAEFLADSRHHLAVALLEEQVIGMASAVHYVHPDKPPQLFINEVGVAPPYQRQGIGRKLVEALLQRGQSLRCSEAWVGTEPTNIAARSLYKAVGGVEAPEHTVIFSFSLLSEA